MKRVSLLGLAALSILPAKAGAETLTCDAVNTIIWKNSKAILANEISLNGLSSKIDIVTAKNGLDQIPALLSEMKTKCQTIIDAAKEAKGVIDAIGALPSQCNSDQAQIDEIRTHLDDEITSCTAVIEEVDQN